MALPSYNMPNPIAGKPLTWEVVFDPDTQLSDITVTANPASARVIGQCGTLYCFAHLTSATVKGDNLARPWSEYFWVESNDDSLGCCLKLIGTTEETTAFYRCVTVPGLLSSTKVVRTAKKSGGP